MCVCVCVCCTQYENDEEIIKYANCTSEMVPGLKETGMTTFTHNIQCTYNTHTYTCTQGAQGPYPTVSVGRTLILYTCFSIYIHSPINIG